MKESILAKIAELLSGQVVQSSAIGGGCINQACCVTLEDGRRFFVKSNEDAPADMFEAEAAGLSAMKSTSTIRIPNVIQVGHCSENHSESHAKNGFESFLILEFVESRPPSSGFSQQLGRQLAFMHQHKCGESRFGFEHDNYLGSLTQPNTWAQVWPEFFAEQRLGHQFKLAARRWPDRELQNLGQRFLSRLGKLLSGSVRPSLLHGDLWSGNFLTDSKGRPVLFDPACYFGDREAEFGMITLFGGFDENFYAAYNEVWPLEEGWEDRAEIYRLYHLLNHLNLFGESYLADCLSTLRKFS